jgi:hypothetical protein
MPMGKLRVAAGTVGGALLAVSLVLTGQSQELHRAKPAHWTYRADWSGGYSGWMSFPLAQDVGYDPSLYTEPRGGHTVLVHKFVSHGETQPWFGLVRPIRFLVGAGTSIEIQYRLKLTGTISSPQLLLAAADGRLYSASLPASEGEHTIRIDAAALHLNASTSIQAIILRGRLQHPPTGSESRWILEHFVLHATRPAEVALSLPHMNEAVDGSWVAREIVHRGEQLHIKWKVADTNTEITLYDPAGAQAGSYMFSPGQWQAAISLDTRFKPGLWRAEIVQGSAKTAFQFLVLGAPPQHSHLLLSQQRLQQLSHDAQYAGLRQVIHQRAETLSAKVHYNVAAGENIELMPSGPGIEPAVANQLQPYLELMEAYANAIAYNALDYELNGNAKSLAVACRALNTIAAWKTWSPPRFHNHGLETYYEVGFVTQRFAFGYDLIADQLSPREREQIAQAFWKQAIEPAVQEYFLYNRNPLGASNWMANSVGGALAAAVAVAGDTPEWNEREAPALAELDFAFEQMLHGLFLKDGSEAEPTGYENFAMQGVSWGMSALADLGIEPQGANTMMHAFWWPYYDAVRPGMQLDTGDFDGHLKALSGFAWGAEHSGIPELRSFYDHGTHLDLSHGAAADQNGHHLEELPGPLDLVCCSASARTVPLPPPSRIFPERGSAVLRSGWGPDATVISLRAGAWFNHEHHDEGSFQVAAFGQALVDEAGYASYYTDPHYVDYFSQAAGHNTLLVDGDPFSQSAVNGRYWAAFKRPHFSNWLLGSSFDFLSADLTSAYDGRLESYQREYLFLKPDLLVVFDRVRSAHPHQFSWLLHTPSGSKLTMNAGHASIELASGAGVSLAAIGPNAHWTDAPTPVSVALFKDLDDKRIEVRHELVLRSKPSASTHFLVGLKFNKEETAQPQWKTWNEAAGEGLRAVQSKPASVIFRTGAGPLRNAHLTTDGAVLALQGKANPTWMAVDATSIEEDGRTIFHTTTPMNVIWERSSSGLMLSLHNSRTATIEVTLASVPQHVEVDGQQVAPTYNNQRLLLPPLPAGDHRVSIR